MALLNLILAAALAAFGLFDAGGTGSPPPKPPDPKDPPADPPKDPPADPPPDGDGEEEGEDEGLKGLDAAALQDRLGRARSKLKAAEGRGKGAAKERDEAKAQLVAVATALGLTGADATPERLQEKLTSTSQELFAERLSNAVYREAVKQGAKPELLMRWLKGGDELKDLNPAAPTFTADVRDLIKTTLEDNEDLRTLAVPPGASGADFRGPKDKGLDDLIAEAQSKGDHREVIRLQAQKLTALPS